MKIQVFKRFVGLTLKSGDKISSSNSIEVPDDEAKALIKKGIAVEEVKKESPKKEEKVGPTKEVVDKKSLGMK